MKIKKLIPVTLAILLSFTFSVSPLSIQADEDDPKPTSIRRLNYKKKTLRTGQKFELEAFARPSDYDDDQLIWTTSNKKVVKIVSRDRRDDDITVKAVKTGKAKITCRIRGTKKKTCTITVKKKAKKKYTKPTRIWVEDRYTDVDVHDWEDIEYKVYPRTATNKKVTFSSSNKKVATVNSRGYIYGKKPGRAKITLTCKDNPKVKAYVHVLVEWDDDDYDNYDDYD